MSKTMDAPEPLIEPPADDEQQYRPAPFDTPSNASSLMSWLDSSPRWVEMEWGGYRDHAEYAGFLHPEYTICKSSFRTKARAFSAWREMKFPRLGGKHTDQFVNSSRFGRARSKGEFPAASGPDGRCYARISPNGAWLEALAHPDGSGFVTYGGSVAYVRTKNRLLLKASEDLKLFSGGWMFGSYQRPPRTNEDGRIPLVNLQELDGTPPLVDITRYEKGDGNVYVHYQDGTVVVVLNDTTANDRDNRKAGFVLSPEEAADTTLPPVSEAERLVMPEPVEKKYRKGMEIVTSDEYASRTGYRTEDGWRHKRTGDHIVRQGEWYLVPKPAYWSPGQPVYKPLPNAERHHDWSYEHLENGQRTVLKKNGVCVCGAQDWHLPNRAPVWICNECKSTFISTGKRLARVEEPLNKKDFHDANDRLDSHKPRDLSLTDDGTPVVRGTFRHLDNEHAMLNVGGQWHEVHENTRDMTVFSYRRGRYAQGGSGSGMRVE